MFALGVAPALYCADATARTVALAGGRPTADAEVVARKRAVKGNGMTVTVRFTTADGRAVTTTVHELHRPPPPAGGLLKVRYNAEHPQYARAADAGPAVGWPLVAGLAAALAFGCGVTMGVRAVRPRRVSGGRAAPGPYPGSAGRPAR